MTRDRKICPSQIPFLSPLGKPCDAKQGPSGCIFPSHPRTRDNFFQSQRYAVIFIIRTSDFKITTLFGRFLLLHISFIKVEILENGTRAKFSMCVCSPLTHLLFFAPVVSSGL